MEASNFLVIFQKLFNIYKTLIIFNYHSGSPSLTGTATLMIKVENSNDKAPYFTPAIQRAQVTEDTPIGTVFTVLQAVDPDSPDPDALNFAMSEPITAIDRKGQQVSKNSTSFKDFFAVDRKTGQVSVVRPLDRDTAATVSITVVVTDTSAPALQQGNGKLLIIVGYSTRFRLFFNRTTF